MFLLPLLANLSVTGLAAAPEPTSSPPIIVTGTRPTDYRAALEACLARDCPPNEDIDATTALAEALFVSGEYHGARTVLRESIARNHDEAALYPEPVSDLYRANSRVARHLGVDGDARRSVRQSLTALQAGLPEEDHRHFTARLEISEMLVAFGDYAGAHAELDRLASRARRAGREDVAAMAEIRSLWITHLETPGDARVMARLTEFARSADPAQRASALRARLMLARIYRDQGDSERSDAMLAELGAAASGHRTLVYAPPYELPVREFRSGFQVRTPAKPDLTGNVLRRLSDNFEDKWIDVGFWIQPDGQVGELEILRRSDDPDWADPLLRSIRGRLYSASSDGRATYRMERYTYTAGFEPRTGSHIPQRSPQARVEYLDLTAREATPRD